MQKNLCTLLNEAKDDSSKMLQAINLFSPLIQKYSKKLFFTGKMQNRRWRWHSFQLFTKWTISTAPENVSALLTKGCIADFVSYARRIHRTQKWQQISFLYLTLSSKKDIRTLIWFVITRNIWKNFHLFTQKFSICCWKDILTGRLLLNYTFLSSTLTVSRKK